MTDFLICWKVRCDEPQGPRRRIDRTMIGPPTDFKHTAHIGAGDHFNYSDITNHSTPTQASEGYSLSSAPLGMASPPSPPALQLAATPPSPNGLSSYESQGSPIHLANLRPIANPLISTPIRT